MYPASVMEWLQHSPQDSEESFKILPRSSSNESINGDAWMISAVPSGAWRITQTMATDIIDYDISKYAHIWENVQPGLSRSEKTASEAQYWSMGHFIYNNSSGYWIQRLRVVGSQRHFFEVRAPEAVNVDQLVFE